MIRVQLQVCHACLPVVGCGKVARRFTGGRGVLGELGGSTEEGQEEDVAMLLPNAAEWMNDAELERAGIWDGFLFSLREWQDGRFRIGVTRVPQSET